MDARERQKIDLILNHHFNIYLAEMDSELKLEKSRNVRGTSLQSELFCRAIINCMGKSVDGFAQTTHAAVLKINSSYECFQIWSQDVHSLMKTVFLDWEETVPETGPVYFELDEKELQLCRELIGHWSDKIFGFVQIGGFDFDEPPPQPRPQIGLDGWPIPGTEALDSGFQEPKPEPKRLSEGALKAWWKGLGPDQALPLVELLKRARAAHPDNFVSRARIRDLAPGRKRGRRPIGGKETAE
jgi:hypothetical protein